LLVITEGGTFAVVPYVLPTAVGGVAGIVGAGGNVGAMLGNAMMVVLTKRTKAARMVAFCALGWGALASAMVIPCLWLQGIGSMFRMADSNASAEPAQIPGTVDNKNKPLLEPSSMAGPQPSFVPVTSVVAASGHPAQTTYPAMTPRM